MLPLVASLAAPPPPRAVLAQAPARDPLAVFQKWLERLRGGKVDLDAASLEGARALLGDLRIAWSVDPGRGRDIATSLLDLVALCLERGGRDPDDGPLAEVRDLAAEALRAHFDPEFLRWLTREVLALPLSQPAPRRAAVVWILAGRREPMSLLPLLSASRETDPRLRRAALQALVGWDEDAVHTVFFDEIARALDGRAGSAAWLAEEHLRGAAIAPGSRLLPRLSALVRRGLASLDWREASRAVAFSRALDHESAVPGLIEALSAWKRRGEAGAQALRVEFEIARALEERSGRRLGLSPESWVAWWAAVRRGEVKGQSPTTIGGVPDSTRAGFFGLRPVSDRVTFVIDRSGSMSTPFAGGTDPGTLPGRRGPPPAARTRWDEAVLQLLGFVEAVGPRARFDVVIFHDFAEAMKPALVAAGSEEQKHARAWLQGTDPGGGTQLKSGIDRALFIGADGRADLARLEADTVIVLCDGATAEGPGWVEPFLERVNHEARVVFHCVQIGSQGDGTLEKLARGSGGDFVRVDG